jgi:2-polyprenyl-3-methyl-5-hydroxy-6-metoxy-1,4-benzoquinol methylase
MKVSYRHEIGYTTYAKVNLAKMKHVINICRLIIDDYYKIKPADKILVAGAGQGLEAELLHETYKEVTVGIDLSMISSKHGLQQQGYHLQKQDLISLAFCNNSFSLIYCYHVLEHVNDYFTALKEMHRVLEPEGILFIGFPNRHRMFAYIGTSQDATIKEKVLWNVNDYRYRIARKFDNKFGAHAGFTEKAFTEIASQLFKQVIPVRNKYFLSKYKLVAILVRLIIMTRLSEVLFPSNYFICKK